MRTRLIYLGLIATSVTLALAVVEIALRIAGTYAPLTEPVKPAQPQLYAPDPMIGYRLRPSLRTTYHYPQASDEEIPVTSNSDGFRNVREFDEPDDRLRILVVGDSFVFGQGVREQDRWTEQLERLEPHWRVDNMGMTGWGLDLMVRAIEQYGRKAKPDVLVLAFYTDDFRRLLPYYTGLGYDYPKFELQGTELTTVPFKYPKTWERFRLYQLLYQTAINTKRNSSRNRYNLNEALLDRFLKDAKELGSRPAVVFVPGINDNNEDQERRSFLKNWSDRRRVPYLDLSSPIHAVDAGTIYVADNTHWNPVGHRIAAEQLRQFLIQSRLTEGHSK